VSVSLPAYGGALEAVKCIMRYVKDTIILAYVSVSHHCWISAFSLMQTRPNVLIIKLYRRICGLCGSELSVLEFKEATHCLEI
jgi:hypothetical protein